MLTFNCKSCGKSFSATPSGNILMICPYCRTDIGSISDYGFGPIVPCDVYVGMEKVAEIDENFVLRSDKYEISEKLKGEYKNLGYYKAVSMFMHEWLSHHETEAQHYIYSG